MADRALALYISGWVVIALGGLLLLPLGLEAAMGGDTFVFLLAASILVFCGGILVTTQRRSKREFSRHSGFLVVAASWIAAGMASAAPFLLSGFTPVDAFFEAVSGITTTGATIVGNPQSLSPGLLLWRALLQWFGGIGFIVTAMIFLPMLKVGGMQLFRLESTDREEKAVPLVSNLATLIGLVYVFLTLACIAALLATGTTAFEAVTHALTTISTGGFSIYAGSVAALANPAAEVVIIVFMILGSLPFVLYLGGISLKNLKNDQVLWFFIILFGGCLLLWWFVGDFSAAGLRPVIFNVTSLMTGTGYTTQDAALWGSFASTLLFCLMLVGGCAGSTTCGLKVFRVQALAVSATIRLRRLLHPRIVKVPQLAGSPLTDEVVDSVLVFFFLFMGALFALSLFLSWNGMDFPTALAASTSAIANVGPVLGQSINATDHLGGISTASKWGMIVGMLGGRLEFYALLVMLFPSFWKP